MARDSEAESGPTRRDYLAYSGALVSSGLFAGCLSNGGAGDAPTTTTAAETATETQTETTTQTTTAEADSFSVTMSPVGEVSFASVPETAYAYSPHYADMAVAFGHGDAIASLGAPDGYGTALNYYYDAIDGANFDIERVKQVWDGGVDKELFYEIDADVHLQDPCWLMSFAEGWDATDIKEVRENIGPWVGNRYSREQAQPPEECRDGYQFYTLWELSEKIATVFQERARYRALHDEYETLTETIESDLPPEADRPTVGLVVYRDGAFRPYEINSPGFAKAHIRPLGAHDVFVDNDQTYDETADGEIGHEAMLELDPDVILHNFGVGGFYDVATVRETLASHPVGSELTAVQNDRVYSSGLPFQGPLTTFFQLEMTAKQLYPDAFGEWPGDGSESSYPDIPADEQLFDRQRLSAIVTGSDS
ncbi:ferrichrome-binding protein [Haloferax mucosum ATCC BAA-1512]|uniref:Ferrichrome-binding protein n=1 Tax=Haloferax mucosum ATCC BAA-1512 TaxID=662479 RepID=M0IQN6_9EURY|nr:ABC transporter substrate-binding protein [Haloferax mucosum]ELZ98138.1 ferrichrome-binding protein [Haloferax mucosum ATCC BAA-1512]